MAAIQPVAFGRKKPGQDMHFLRTKPKISLSEKTETTFTLQPQFNKYEFRNEN